MSPVEWKLLWDTVPMGILCYSDAGGICAANTAALKLFRTLAFPPAAELNLFTFPAFQNAGISHYLQDTLETGRSGELQTEHALGEHQVVSLRIIALRVEYPIGGESRGIAFIQDVSRQKLVEKALQKSEKRFYSLTDRTPLGIAVLTRDGVFTYANPAFLGMFGYTPKETPSLAEWLGVVLPEPTLREAIREAVLSCFDAPETAGESQPYLDMQSRDESFKKVRIRSFPVSDEDIVLVCEDCSQLEQAWGAHRTSEATYQGLFEQLTDFVYTLDPDGILLNVNRAAAKSLGYEPEEVIGRPVADIIPESVRAFIPRNLKKVLDEGYAEGMSKYLAKDGDLHYLEYRSVAIRPEDRPPYVVGVARDVTERVTMQRKLKESETKFQLLVESAHDGITYIDAEGTIQFANPRMKEILKDLHPEGKKLKDFYNEENTWILEKNLEIRSKGFSTTYFSTLTDLEGNQRSLVVSGTPFLDERKNYLGAIGVYTDISELRKLEAQLQQSQKMEAVGTLAGGIAHDFNNILGGVLGYASLIRQLVPPDSQLAHYAAMIEKSAERGAATAGQLLAFSRKGKQFVQIVDVHQIIDEVVEILSHTLDRKVNVHTRKDAPRSLVKGDPAQIQQVLMNLCINANDAMPGGGILTISTGLMEADESFCMGQENLIPGTFFELKVEDTGAGMTPYVMGRLFEPFFTTKEEGKGTGLGLSMVYGAVTNHGGTVKVSSHIDKGSLFTVLLPLHDAQSGRSVQIARRPAAYGSGTILVVDDEDIIRQLLTEMLQEMGFNVLSACDGIEALEVYHSHWRAIDLVIMDLIMPRLSGKETFRAMRDINPEARVILATGYSRETTMQEALEDGILGFLHKPFGTEELSEAVALVFSGREVRLLQDFAPFPTKKT
jgi:PAS domain S-box-containing protein